MPKEIANKTKGETYYKCTHCGDEIFWNTKRNLVYCKCKKMWVDSCATLVSYERSKLETKKYPCGKDYIRIGGKEGDREVITK